jgi:glucose-1-phosphate thymidylyltransferase
MEGVLGDIRMKGIVLAGGMGTRLAPLTKENNKHALAVYDKMMLEYPIDALVKAGVKDIILITGGKKPGQFLEFFKNGADHGINKLYYTYQEGSGGITDALKLARPFMDDDESCVVILGDNYFEQGVTDLIESFENDGSAGASVYLRHTNSPWDFGIAEVDGSGIVSIEEKPAEPRSNLAILGCYVFDKQVWNIADEVKVSDRGELEITDVLRAYMQKSELNYQEYNGFWKDMGSFDSLLSVSQRVAKQGAGS